MGVNSTMKEIRAIDKKLAWQTINDIKGAAGPLKEAVKNNFPSAPPLSGMKHNGRTGWPKRNISVTTKYGGKRRRNRTEWPLVSVRVKSPAGQIVDMANQGHTARGSRMVSALGGSASRYVWPAVPGVMPGVVVNVTAAVERASNLINKRLWMVK
jgi:hypothetical protein